MKTWFPPTGNYDAGDDRDEGAISDPSLPLERHQVREHRREEGRGRAHRLIERHGEVPERHVAAHHRRAEHHAQGRNLDELGPGFDQLERDELQEDYGDVAEGGTGGHVAHCEEDGVPEAIVGEQELVEEDDADVGGVPERDEGSDEEGLLLGGRHWGDRAAFRWESRADLMRVGMG